MSSVLCLSILLAVLLFVGRYCSAFSVPRPRALGVRIPRNIIWRPEITVPPKKPVIMDENGEIVHNVTGPDKYGGVYLICETVGGKPTPSLTWWNENMLLDDSYEVTDEGVVRNTIVINAGQVNALWDNFTCLASNNNLTSPVYTTVIVDMSYSTSVSSSEEKDMNSNESIPIKMELIHEVIPIIQKYGYHEVTKVLAHVGRKPPQSLVGVAGSSFDLPCDITAPTLDDSVVLVLWYKNGVVEPLYALDTSWGNLNEARHRTVDHLNGSVYMFTNLQPAILRFDFLLEEDEGQYRCRVDFRKAPTRYFDLILTVIVPPKKPVIMDENGEIVHNLRGPNKNGEVYLKCETVRGKPTPSLTWWKESVLLDDNYEVTNEGVVRNEIVINTRLLDALWTDFTCQASINNLTAPVSATVAVARNHELKVNPNGSISVNFDIDDELTPITRKDGYHEIDESLSHIVRATSDADSDNRPTFENAEDISVLGNVTIGFAYERLDVHYPTPIPIADRREESISVLVKNFDTRFHNDEEAVYSRPLMRTSNLRCRPIECPVCECPMCKGTDRKRKEKSDVSMLSKREDIFKRK